MYLQVANGALTIANATEGDYLEWYRFCHLVDHVCGVYYDNTKRAVNMFMTDLERVNIVQERFYGHYRITFNAMDIDVNRVADGWVASGGLDVASAATDHEAVFALIAKVGARSAQAAYYLCQKGGDKMFVVAQAGNLQPPPAAICKLTKHQYEAILSR